MPKMIVEFEWNEELGEKWMNMDNLHLLLYGQAYTKQELLTAKDVSLYVKDLRSIVREAIRARD